ncbi:MAG: YceI family protein [Sulfurimonas sp.]|nr:YceI family protein [Sulfurimonas sp.]MDD3834684.1 YceI family protein [Sulfurimonas sp.]
MIKLFLSLVLAFSVSLAAGEMGKTKGSCILSQEGNVVVNWESYKTPKKVGVGGSFDKVTYTAAAAEGNNFREILVGSSVVIETPSVNSKHESRDETLVKFFFNQMKDTVIKAKIVDIKSDKRMKGKPKTGEMSVEITMNGVTKVVPMKYVFDKGDLSAKGSIDLLDFSASKALSSINEACYDLHEGKTWSDVGISFSTKIKFDLCNTK